VISVSGLYWDSVFLNSEGNLMGVGRNQFGQLGDGSTSYKETPFKIEAILQSIEMPFHPESVDDITISDRPWR
jgi:alpha-tubulin suppressor-like RCC1 family protein